MKTVRHIICLLLLLKLSSPLLAVNSLQLMAEQAYAHKNYKQAIVLYESILKEGMASYKLYYNLGNAYYKNNELGKAIYHYELANKLEPNNDDVKTNLKIVNEKTIDKIESKENYFIIAIKSGLVNSLSTNGWAWLSILSLVSGLTFAFIFFITKHIGLKRIGFFICLISVITCMASMILGFTALNNKQELKFAIITNYESKIHEEPSTESKNKFSLHEGSKVNVLETNIEWTNIKLENGNEGWVKTSEIGLF